MKFSFRDREGIFSVGSGCMLSAQIVQAQCMMRGGGGLACDGTGGTPANAPGVNSNAIGNGAISSGISMSFAMANARADLSNGERGALGVGLGTFEGKKAIDLGTTIRLDNKEKTKGTRVLFNSTAGFGINENNFGAGLV